MKRVYIGLIFFIFVIIILNSISAETNFTDYGKQYGIKQGDLIGKYLVVTKSSDNNINIKFNENNGILILKDKRFENIKSGEIIVDSNGEIVKVDFTVGEKGGTYNILGTEFYAPAGSVVKYEKGGKIEVITQFGAKLISFPKSSDGIGPDVSYIGENLILPNSIEILGTGAINFRNDGQAYITRESLDAGFVINNIKFFGAGEIGKYRGDYNLYFDGEKHEGNYISLGETNFFVNSKDSKISFLFFEKNPYAYIEPGDYLSFVVGENTDISFRNRDNDNLVPEVITKGSDIRIADDYKLVYVSALDNIIIEKIQENTKALLSELRGSNYIINSLSKSNWLTNSPIDLTMLKSDGSNYLGDFKFSSNYIYPQNYKISGNRILIDNFHRIGIIPTDSVEGFSSYEGLNTKFSSRISYNYPTQENIETLTGVKFQFSNSITQGNKETVLGKFRDYYDELTPEMQKSLKKIGIYSEERWKEVKGNNNFVGIAFYEGTIGFSYKYFSNQVFMHEVGHLRHDDIQISGPVLITKIDGMVVDRKYINEFDNYWKTIEKEKVKIKDNKDGHVVYREYSGYSDQEIIDNHLYSTAKGPRGGYVIAYGAQNQQEDIATYVGFANEPKFWIPLLANDNPWRDSYYQGLTSLYKYKFITKQQYERILKTAGIDTGI